METLVHGGVRPERPGGGEELFSRLERRLEGGGICGPGLLRGLLVLTAVVPDQEGPHRADGRVTAEQDSAGFGFAFVCYGFGYSLELCPNQ